MGGRVFNQTELSSEVFAVCSLGLFLPVCLEQFARDNGVLLPGKTIPCPTVGTIDDARCVVHFGWAWIDSASYSLYVFSASVAAQAITVISLGGLADNCTPLISSVRAIFYAGCPSASFCLTDFHNSLFIILYSNQTARLRKSILLFFAALGSVATILFLAVPSSSRIWAVSSLLTVIANVSFGVSIVCLNSYLPQLARADSGVKAAYSRLQSIRDGEQDLHEQGDEDDAVSNLDAEAQTLLSQPQTAESPTRIDDSDSAPESYTKLVSRATSRISSKGIAIGYSAGIALLLLLLVPVTLLKGSTFALRLSISLTGVWWLVFTIPAALWLPGRSSSDVTDTVRSGQSTAGQIAEAWRRLALMLRPSEIRELKNTFWFLLAWFILSDGALSLLLNPNK